MLTHSIYEWTIIAKINQTKTAQDCRELVVNAVDVRPQA